MNTRIIVIASALGHVGTAAAAESIDLGLWLGQAQTDVRGHSTDIQSVDDKDTSWGLELGYPLNGDFNVTLGYVDQGSGSMQLQADTLTPEAYHQQVSKLAPLLADGMTLGAEYNRRLDEQFALFAQAGAFFWQAEIESRSSTQKLNSHVNGTDLYLGIGARYLWSSNCSVSLRFRQYRMDESVNEWSVGIGYRF